jgi:HKD family nuclease
MKQWLVVQGLTKGNKSLFDEIVELTKSTEFDRLNVAVAYATIDGIRTLEEALGGIPEKSQWLIGLDDAITQPGAIDLIKTFAGSEVKVISLTREKRRFHPKMYRLWSSANSSRSLLIIGSGNLTRHGLKLNGEAGVLLQADNLADANGHQAPWPSIWAAGKTPTEQLMAEYTEKYKAARKARKKVAQAGAAPPDETQEVDLAVAKTLWLDIGSANSNGTDIDLPRSLTSYFGIIDGQTAHPDVQLIAPDKTLSSATLKFYGKKGLGGKKGGNKMWRLQLRTNTVSSLAPPGTFKKGRSDYALCLVGLPNTDTYQVKVVKIGTAEYEKLQKRSEGTGTLGRTDKSASGRNYGFF